MRPIKGIPGAALLSAAVALPQEVISVNFAPGQEYAIVERASGASIGVIGFPNADPGPLIPVTRGISKPDIIAFSPNGGAVALYSASEGRLQVLGGLPDKPQMTRDMLSGELPDAVRLLAIADDGVTLLEGTVNSAVYLLAASGPQLLESVSDLAGIAFNPKTIDAVVLDRDGGTLSLLQGVGSVPSSRVLAHGLVGLEGIIALATNGSSAVITNANAKQLWEVDLKSLKVQTLKLPTTPEMLKPLRVNGHYLLSWEPGRLSWIVDTNQEKGILYPVPAGVAAQSAQAY